jgi:hypothetical protein
VITLFIDFTRPAGLWATLRSVTKSGPAWPVGGINGENSIEARGATRDEAWQNAVLQAEDMSGLMQKKR